MSQTPFNIQWRSNEGYGDFISGLGYSHSSVIKYQRPVNITFHWPNAREHLFSDKDNETIFFRFEQILAELKPVDGLTINHVFNSVPKFRFINQLEEFNPLHGLWYPKEIVEQKNNLVLFWSSKHNVTFPGYDKDPCHDSWEEIIDALRCDGYDVIEITYRTPIKEVISLIKTCEFGIGYEGMVHQLFKVFWKPLIVATRRKSLNELLIPQATIVTNPEELLYSPIQTHVKRSKENIKKLLVEHIKYVKETQDPTKHKLYNEEIC